MKSTEKKIEKFITYKRKGTLFLPVDFLSYGSSEAIRKALGRLEDKKIIIIVSQGIYVQPKISKLIGPLTPSAEEVAEAITKRDKIRTIPTGSYALNALGLSSQVPMKIVLLTDGSPREIKVGKRLIKFKRTTPKNLMAKGKINRRSLREPYTIKMLGSLVDEVYKAKDFAEPLFAVSKVIPERTFLEKLFLLHEEFHRPAEKMRVDRLSRHIYDVYHLTKAGIAKNAISDQELYETIVQHRYKFSKIGGVHYNAHNPKTVNPIPSENVIKDWKSDYTKMREDMIYEGNPPTFVDLIDCLKEIREQLKSVNWEFELSFPNS